MSGVNIYGCQQVCLNCDPNSNAEKDLIAVWKVIDTEENLEYTAGEGVNTIGTPWDSVLDRPFNLTFTDENDWVGSLSNTVVFLAIQSDGKFLVALNVSPYLIRLHNDGSVDGDFQFPGANNTVNAIAIQQDAKIIIGGGFTSVGGQTRNGIVRLNENGTIDSSFNIGNGFDNFVNSIVVIPSTQKVLVGGAFLSYNGVINWRGLVRLNSNGSLDNSFNNGSSGLNGSVARIFLDVVERIMIAGDFTTYSSQNRNGIARIQSNGVIDTSFNPGAGIGGGGVYSFAINNSNQIAIGGDITSYNNVAISHIALLNDNGSLVLDSSLPRYGTGFNSIVLQTIFQPDGKLLACGFFTTYQSLPANRLIRINVDGSLDTTFRIGTGLSNSATAMVLQPDQKIVVGGSFQTYNSRTANRIVRVRPYALIDNIPLNQYAILSSEPNQETLGRYKIQIQMIDGYEYIHNAQVVPFIATPVIDVNITRSSNSLVYLYGTDIECNEFQSTEPIPPIAEYNNTTIEIYQTETLRFRPVHRSQICPSEFLVYTNVLLSDISYEIVYAGPGSYTGDLGEIFFENVLQDGQICFRYQLDSFLTEPLEIQILLSYTTSFLEYNDFLVQEASNIEDNETDIISIRILPVLVTLSRGVSSNLYDSNGDPISISCSDPTNLVEVTDQILDVSGCQQLCLQCDVEIKAAKKDWIAVWKIVDTETNTEYTAGVGVETTGTPWNSNPNRPFDLTFPNQNWVGSLGPGVVINVVTLQGDGKFLVGFTGSPYLIRLNRDGSADNTFSFAGTTGLSTSINAIAIEQDGKIVIGGNFTSIGGQSRNRIARLNENGTLDSTFSVGTGFGPSGSQVNAIVIQETQKIVVGGNFTSYQGLGWQGLARLNNDGSLDTTFNNGSSGLTSTVLRIFLDSFGRILISGNFTAYSGQSQIGIARLQSNGVLDSSFNSGTGISGGAVSSFAVNEFDQIILGGSFTLYNNVSTNRIVLVNDDGSIVLDNSLPRYRAGFNNDVLRLILQPDGNLLACGSFTTYQSLPANRIIRISQDGSMDTSFRTGIGFTDVATAMALQPDKKIVIGGSFLSYNGQTTNQLVRLTPYGSIDTISTNEYAILSSDATQNILDRYKLHIEMIDAYEYLDNSQVVPFTYTPLIDVEITKGPSSLSYLYAVDELCSTVGNPNTTFEYSNNFIEIYPGQTLHFKPVRKSEGCLGSEFLVYKNPMTTEIETVLMPMIDAYTGDLGQISLENHVAENDVCLFYSFQSELTQPLELQILISYSESFLDGNNLLLSEAPDMTNNEYDVILVRILPLLQNFTLYQGSAVEQYDNVGTENDLSCIYSGDASSTTLFNQAVPFQSSSSQCQTCIPKTQVLTARKPATESQSFSQALTARKPTQPFQPSRPQRNFLSNIQPFTAKKASTSVKSRFSSFIYQ